jgi:tRNA nucleotidyltransferase/poly(A) polymerase
MIQFDNAVERYGKIILTELKDSGINCWLAGGALRDYFAGIVIKTDYDIFFPNDEEYQKCAKFFKDKEAIVIWESDNGMKVKYNIANTSDREWVLSYTSYGFVQFLLKNHFDVHDLIPKGLAVDINTLSVE